MLGIASTKSELHALPKIDLHRHLEGSLRLRTLAEIAREHSIDLPGYAIEDLRPLATVNGRQTGFQPFLEKFRFLRRFYPTREAVERVAYEAVTDAAEDNVRYLELRFNPVALAQNRAFSLGAVTAWVCAAVREAQRERDIRANLIVQIGREETLNTATELLDVALAHRDEGVVGLDLAGDERTHSATRFIDLFRRARAEGLHITVHAGEVGGPANVAEAIEHLHAERIGHGVRAVGDPQVVRLIRERQVALEVCPTSNVQTGVVRDFWHHPLPDMLAMGLSVSINTDDPSISDTTLTDEYWVAMSAMGITLQAIKETIVGAAEASFQPPTVRQRMAAWFRTALLPDDPAVALDHDNEQDIDRRNH